MNILSFVDGLAGKWLDWRMRQKADNDEHAKLIKVDVNERNMEILMSHPTVAYLADECAQILNESDAENYLSFDMMPRIDRKLPWIRVTIQWANGLSPAQKASKLENELEQLKIYGREMLPYIYEADYGHDAYKEGVKRFENAIK